jgi:hypothetical protein
MLKALALQASLVLAVGTAAVIQDSPTAKPERQDGSAGGIKKATSPPVQSKWKLEWDDRVDGVVQQDSKACEVNLGFGDNRVEGKFSGQVLGKTRDARFVGELIAGSDTKLLLLRQNEESYVCAYQCQMAADGSFSGVWHDNTNRSGDVHLRRLTTDAK